MSRRIWVPLVAMVLLSACQTMPTSRPDPDEETPASVNTQLGMAYFREGAYDEALEKLQKAVSQDPRYGPAHNALAIVYERLGEMDVADRYYRRAIALAPDDSQARNNYGQFLCRRGRLQEAEKHFDKAVANPLYARPQTALTNAGICALQIPDEAKAERYFRQALEKDPRYAIALVQMLKLMFQQGEYLSARAYLQRYEAVARHTAETLWYGIRIEDELGDKNAVASYALALQKQYPDAPQTREYQDWLDEQATGP
jgi:type IV pilus assembly protein PilF